MKIISFSENKDLEKRVAITPEIIKKYNSIGFEISLPKGYASHLGFSDEEYMSQGVKFLDNEKDLIKDSDIIVQLNLPDDDKLSYFKENQILVGILNPYSNKDKLENLSKKKVNNFSLELLPRITRAQSMDILSSQANLAGYKAVVDSFALFKSSLKNNFPSSSRNCFRTTFLQSKSLLPKLRNKAMISTTKGFKYFTMFCCRACRALKCSLSFSNSCWS